MARTRAARRLPEFRDRFGNAHGDAVRLAAGDDLDPAATRSVARAGDRLRRIVDDVHEDLLDLIRVDLHFGQSRLEGQRELDARREQLVFQKLVRGLENRPDRLELALALLPPGEREEVADNGRRALRFLPNYR